MPATVTQIIPNPVKGIAKRHPRLTPDDLDRKVRAAMSQANDNYRPACRLEILNGVGSYLPKLSFSSD